MTWGIDLADGGVALAKAVPLNHDQPVYSLGEWAIQVSIAGAPRWVLPSSVTVASGWKALSAVAVMSRCSLGEALAAHRDEGKVRGGGPDTLRV